jgi:hypothetical protein
LPRISLVKEESRKVSLENASFFKENRDMQEQLKVLNDNLKR